MFQPRTRSNRWVNWETLVTEFTKTHRDGIEAGNLEKAPKPGHGEHVTSSKLDLWWNR
jgi:hypothetical protein